MRILLVEDDPRLQTIGRKVLERGGYDVLVAEDGEEAIRIASEEQPVVILMDISLPGLDGLEATRRIKQTQPDMPIVAVTAHAMAGDRDRCLEAGCDAFITKPYDLQSLLDTVATLIPE